jgi:copper chaperone CopZ
MSQTTLSVPDISCEHCEHAILEALKPQEGIESVAVDIGAKTVRVTYDEQRIDVNRMKTILEEEDYPVASTT